MLCARVCKAPALAICWRIVYIFTHDREAVPPGEVVALPELPLYTFFSLAAAGVPGVNNRRDQRGRFFLRHYAPPPENRAFYAKESIPEGPEGIILESVMEGYAEYYSENLSQNP